MNGYQIQAEAYRQVLASDQKVGREHLEKQVKIFDFLGSLDEEELCMVFDSGAFNEITKAYCRRAMNGVDISREQTNAVMEEMRWLFDTVGAAQVLNG